MSTGTQTPTLQNVQQPLKDLGSSIVEVLDVFGGPTQSWTTTASQISESDRKGMQSVHSFLQDVIKSYSQYKNQFPPNLQNIIPQNYVDNTGSNSGSGSGGSGNR